MGMADNPIILPVTMEEIDDGRVLLYTSAIQGCLAEGDDLEDAILNIEDVARVLLEVREEYGDEIPPGMSDFRNRGFRAQVQSRFPV